MMGQKIREIHIDNLHLWTENPRDPIEKDCTDEYIINKAISENGDKWNLPKLLKDMGDYYDLSEIPIVVEELGQYIVYDGNRRLAVLKYLQNKSIYENVSGRMYMPDIEPKQLLEFKNIPCDVCSRDTALTSIERKHVRSGSWGQLERDYFEYKHRGALKSLFVMLDEQTGGYISKNKVMNQRFIKDEVLTEENLEEIGFLVKDGEIVSAYNDEEIDDILEKIKELLDNKIISTRRNRCRLKKPLIEEYPELSPLLSKKSNSKETPLKVVVKNNSSKKVSLRKTPRNKRGGVDTIFNGESLELKKGEVNDIYRDIIDLYNYYDNNKNKLSPTFPVFFRMGLRLIVESASIQNEKGRGDIAKYVNNNYDDAKRSLSQDSKTFLSSQSINSGQDLIKLLQSGGHNYTASAGIEQTIAMSIIVKEMLKITHSKKKQEDCHE